MVEVKGKSLIPTHSGLHVLLVNKSRYWQWLTLNKREYIVVIQRKEGSNDHNEHVILGGALVVEVKGKITHTLGDAHCLTD